MSSKQNFKSGEKCVICSHFADNQNCHHHVYSKKAFPEYKYEKWNLLSVCLQCHGRIHNLGLSIMAEKSFNLKEWLINNGWEFKGKWIHGKMGS